MAKPKLPRTLRDDLLAIHDVRNSFVHGGSVVDGLELDKAIDAAHALAEHVRLPGHERLVGVPTVVAAIIDMEAIGLWLRFADEQRKAGHLRRSADGIAQALDAALDRTVPRVRSRPTYRSNWELGKVEDRDLSKAIENVSREAMEAIGQLTPWVYSMALGTSPASLENIRAIVGTAGHEGRGGYPSPVRRPNTDEPALADLARVSSLASRIILRLAVMGGLRAGPADDQIAAMAREVLDDPEKANRIGLG